MPGERERTRSLRALETAPYTYSSSGDLIGRATHYECVVDSSAILQETRAMINVAGTTPVDPDPYLGTEPIDPDPYHGTDPIDSDPFHGGDPEGDPGMRLGGGAEDADPGGFVGGTPEVDPG